MHCCTEMSNIFRLYVDNSIHPNMETFQPHDYLISAPNYPHLSLHMVFFFSQQLFHRSNSQAQKHQSERIVAVQERSDNEIPMLHKGKVNPGISNLETLEDVVMAGKLAVG